MTVADLQILAPFLVLTAAIAAQLVVASTSRAHGPVAALGVLGGLGAAGVAVEAASGPTAVVGPLVFDPFGQIMLAVTTASAAVASALAWQRTEAMRAADPSVAEPVELHLLLTISAFGGALLAVSNHALILLLGVEIAAVAYVAAVAWRRDDAESIEAAIKALVLGAVAAAFLLYGFALGWADVGALTLPALAKAGPLASLLVLVGFGIKLGAAPFHGWVADTWDGATGPVAMYLGTAAKVGLVAAVVRAWPDGGPGDWAVGLAATSMLGGALLGLGQRRVRRMLAASSIAHIGDLLLGASVGGVAAQQAVALYALGYALSVAAVFAALELFAGAGEADAIDGLRGAGRRQPAAAALLTVGVASVAGLPFTAGFAGKLALFQAAAVAGAWPALAVLAAATVISGAMYLRLLFAVWDGDAATDTGVRRPIGLAAALAVAVIALGVRPDLVAVPIWRWIS